jgi:hypothetical protein
MSSAASSSDSDPIGDLYKRLDNAVRAKDDWEVLLVALRRSNFSSRKDVTDAQLSAAEQQAHAVLRAIADMRSFRSSTYSERSAYPACEIDNARSRILQARHAGNFKADTFVTAIEHLFANDDISGTVSILDVKDRGRNGVDLVIKSTYRLYGGEDVQVQVELLPAQEPRSATEQQQYPRFRGLLLNGVEYTQQRQEHGTMETVFELCNRFLESAFPCRCSTASIDGHAMFCLWRKRLDRVERDYGYDDLSTPTDYPYY